MASDDKLDTLVLRELDDVEARTLAQLQRLRDEERKLSAQREAAARQAHDRIAHSRNPYLWDEPEAQSAATLQNIARAKAELDVAAAPHDEVLRRIRETVDEVQRIGRERERIVSVRLQRQNLLTQRWVMIWTAVIAIFTIGLFWRSIHG